MNDAEQVFAFLSAETGPAALVTVTGVTGSSTRNPGAHMGVAADGRFAGSLSGGCIEAAVVAEALAAIAAGVPRRVRFGAGSPFIDIRLPCGGGIDLLVTPLVDAGLAREAQAAFAARTPFVLTLPDQGAPTIARDLPAWRTCATGQGFAVSHLPALRLVIAGHGAAVEQLDAQARAFGAATRVITPDRALAELLSARGTAVVRLDTPDQPLALEADRWTAIAFLFHDHDWEPALLRQALASPAFYIGAMGSRATQAERLARLGDPQLEAAAAARLRAPIGIVPSSRDPQVLALSTLAEIVRDHQAAIRRPDCPAAARGPRHPA